MSEPRTLYVIDIPLNNQIEMVAHLKWAGVLVPATVDDLLAALPKCEHGNYARHPLVQEYPPRTDHTVAFPQYEVRGWCDGGAALGGTDE